MADQNKAFGQGVACFRLGNYTDAIARFSEALEAGGDAFKIYDARAAVYQKLGKLKEALRDSKAAIDLQPGRWQGYARSARLFFQIRKYDAAARMVDLALERAPAARHDEMAALRTEIITARDQAAEEAAKLVSLRAYHFGKLPLEIAHAVFSMALAEDLAFAVVLAQVCKNWRTAVLGTSSFWETLVLGDRHPRRKIKLWKERSRSRIRELVLLRDFTDTPSVLDELQALSPKFIRTIRLDAIPMRGLARHLPSSISTAVLSHLGGMHKDIPVSIRGEIYWQEHTPKFVCRELDVPSVSTRVDWAVLSDKLRDLHACSLSSSLTDSDWPHLLWLLHNNPSIQRLAITTFHPTNFEHPPDRELPPVLTLPHLTDLHIENSAPDRILPLLSLPSLKTLLLASSARGITLSLTHLCEGAASILTSLTIRRTVVNPSLFIQVLGSANALETLGIISIGMKNASVVLEALSRPVDPAHVLQSGSRNPQCTPGTVYCPALRHLDCSNNDDLKGGPLVRLVKLRLTPAEASPDTTEAPGEAEGLQSIHHHVQPLQSLRIDGCPAVDADIVPWLRQHVPIVSCVYMSKKNAGWKR